MQILKRLTVFLLIGFVSFATPITAFADEEVTSETVQLTLVISATDQVNITAVKQVKKGISAFDAIAGMVTMKTKDTSWGPQIMALAGIEVEANNYWALYVDGKMSIVGATDIILHTNTVVLLNIETF